MEPVAPLKKNALPASSEQGAQSDGNALGLQQTGEVLAFAVKDNQGEDCHSRAQRIEGTGKEDVEQDDVHDDGADQGQAKSRKTTAQQQRTTDHFDHLHHGQETGGIDGSKEERRRRACRGLGHGDEVEPEVQAEDDEDESKQDCS